MPESTEAGLVERDSTRLLSPPLTVLDEQALAVLDDAARSDPFDTDILRSAPASDMRVQIEKIVALLNAVEAGKLLRRQGLLSSLTGADVEARLEFELSAQRIMLAMDLLLKAAANGRHIRSKLAEGRVALRDEQVRLNDVVAAARQVLAADNKADSFLRARYERRLSNIMAIHAANIITIEQIGLAEQVLNALLDRVTDVETMLLPMWQRSVIALAHASPGAEQRAAADTFIQVHDKLVAYLVQETSQ